MNGLFDRIFRDKAGHIVIWQMPNAPLWLWIASAVAGLLIHGSTKTVVGVIGSISLSIWAIMEIGWGKSLFRRLLGAVVLVGILASGAMKLLR